MQLLGQDSSTHRTSLVLFFFVRHALRAAAESSTEPNMETTSFNAFELLSTVVGMSYRNRLSLSFCFVGFRFASSLFFG